MVKPCKSPKIIFKIIYNIFFGLIVLVTLLLIVSVLPITGNFKILTVLSGSMEPKIHTGSIVVVKPESNYRVGDIITFGKISKTQVPTTHRIADIKLQEGKPVYITKGDANNSADMKEVLSSEVVGRVSFTIPYVGYAVDFAKKPFGFMVVIVVPGVIIVYDEIRKIKNEVLKMKKKKDETDKKQDEEIEGLEKEAEELKK
jgi:signal peptidase